MKIRHATRSDHRGIADIHAESWKNAYPDVLPAEFLVGRIDRVFESHWSQIQIQNRDILLVAEEDSLLGFVAVWCRPFPFIDNLHVRPSQRSKKIGSALMDAVAKE